MEKKSLLEKRTQALQNSVKYMRAFIDNQPSYVCVLDLKNNEFIDSSQKFLNTFGYISPKELQEKFKNPKKVISEECCDFPQLSESKDWIQELLKEQDLTFRVEIELEGKLKTFEITAYNMLYFSGVSDEDYSKNNFTVLMLHDITSLINEISKNKEQEKLLVRNHQKAMMGDLVSIVSHQLKQPLNTLALLNYIIAGELESGEINREKIAEISSEIESKIDVMAETIEHFKNFFKEDRFLETFSLKKGVEEGIGLLHEQLKANGIEVVSQLEEVSAKGMKIEFIQVVLNLLSNAKDVLIERKPEKPKISITLKKEGAFAKVFFRDNGGGAEKEILSKIFDNGFTTKGKKGTGIGLNLVQTIVREKMDGEIAAQNRENGLEFTITIPLKNTQESIR